MIPPVDHRPPEAVADFTDVPPLVFRSVRGADACPPVKPAPRSNDLDRGGRSWRRFALGLAVGVFLTAVAAGAAPGRAVRDLLGGAFTRGHFARAV